MADPPFKEVTNRSLDNQKFVYVQIPPDNLQKNDERTMTILPNRSGSGFAQFIPLRAKINPVVTVMDSMEPKTQINTLKSGRSNMNSSDLIISIKSTSSGIMSPTFTTTTRLNSSPTVHTVYKKTAPVLSISSVGPQMSTCMSSNNYKTNNTTITVLGGPSGPTNPIIKPSVSQTGQSVILQTPKYTNTAGGSNISTKVVNGNTGLISVVSASGATRVTNAAIPIRPSLKQNTVNFKITNGQIQSDIPKGQFSTPELKTGEMSIIPTQENVDILQKAVCALGVNFEQETVASPPLSNTTVQTVVINASQSSNKSPTIESIVDSSCIPQSSSLEINDNSTTFGNPNVHIVKQNLSPQINSISPSIFQINPCTKNPIIINASNEMETLNKPITIKSNNPDVLQISQNPTQYQQNTVQLNMAAQNTIHLNATRQQTQSDLQINSTSQNSLHIPVHTIKKPSIIKTESSPLRSERPLSVTSFPKNKMLVTSLFSNDNKKKEEIIKVKTVGIDSQKSLDDIDTKEFSQLLEWKDGLGTLEGSKLKFKKNEFDVLELIEDGDLTDIIETKKKENKPTSQHVHHSRKTKLHTIKDDDSSNDQSLDSETSKPNKEDDICCCKNCGCYGLTSEFFRKNSFCSVACGDEFDAREIEWGKEQLRIEKQRERQRKFYAKHKMKEQIAAALENPIETIIIPEETVTNVDEDSRDSKQSSDGKSDIIKITHKWKDYKNNFSWVKYLEHCGKMKGLTKAAPLKLWPEPFPFGKNLFRPGMKLEGIDPCHQSLFCVLTVVATAGHRVRLHFDGYSDVHDFWVNADSANIFHAGWCEKNGRPIETPPGIGGFTWKAYLDHCKAIAAPKQGFLTRNSSTVVPPSNFRIGMKLEAEDRKNGWLCVASVADVLDNKVLIHFDGWHKDFDYWIEVTSPFIHPVGWCSDNGVYLYPPKDYANSDSFTWHEYLIETNSTPVPARAFKTRPPREYKVNMRLEAVDKRNPMLIRVVTIVEIKDYRIKLHFDGWDDVYDYWVDDDSPDIHPPMWCAKTGHNLEPPLTPEQCAEDIDNGMGCGTPGCKGYGHIKGPIYTTHHTAYGCPYSLQNVTKDLDLMIPDRLEVPVEKKKSKVNKIILNQDITPLDKNYDEDNEIQSKRVRKRRKFFDEISQPKAAKTKLSKSVSDEIKPTTSSMVKSSSAEFIGFTTTSTSASSTYSNSTSSLSKSGSTEPQSIDAIVHESVFNPGYHPKPPPVVPHSWKKHSHIINSVGVIHTEEVILWRPIDVFKMISKIPGCADVASKFFQQQIDGEALLMLTQNDIVNILGIKLGPAMKIMAVIFNIKCLKS